jgi:2-methylcitrate dehydratase PrpD
LALAQEIGVSRRALILAFVLGIEVEAKVGTVMGGRHYALGWHPTSTLGTLGAAAACATLLGLDVTRTQMALGIAASMACGVRANFGTMTKPLHVGLAARNGLQAALLALQGFTAAEGALDAPDGFLNAFLGGRVEAEPHLPPLGQPYDIV